MSSAYLFFSDLIDAAIPNPPSDIKVQHESATSLLITWTPDPGVATPSRQHLVTYIVKYRWEGEEKWSKKEVKEYNNKN